MRDQRDRRKFKNYLFVNKAQTTIFISNLVVMLVVIGLFILLVIQPFYSDMLKSNDMYQQHAASQYFIVLLERCVWVFFALFIPLLIQQAVVIHKICGPFVRFKHMLNDFSKGDLSKRVYLRKYDFFQSEAGKINDILEKLSQTLSNVNDQQKDIIDELSKLSSLEVSNVDSEYLVESISSKVQKSIDELSKIKIISDE